MSNTDEYLPLDASDLDNYVGRPLPVHQLREPVAVNDIRRWVQGMHYPNPLHFDPDYAAEGRWGDIVAPQSFVASTEIAHGVWPANVGKIENSALLFGGDEWWFFGPRIKAGEHIKCYPMPFDYKVTNTGFAGPTCFQRGDTTYINTNGERVALQRSTTIRYNVENARKKEAFQVTDEPEWTDEALAELDARKVEFIESIRALGHEKRLFSSVKEGDKLATNVLGPHSLPSFTTEWRAFPFTTWYGARRDFWSADQFAEAGYADDFQGHEGDPVMERFNPELTDGAYYGPSRGHLQPKWARKIGMPRGYGYGASMGAWIIDSLAAWAGEWGFVQHVAAQYRNPAFTGDATFIDGVVTGLRQETDVGIAEITISMTTQTGQVMAKAVAEVELPLA
ncbi:MaoC family dehydratase N-terminal domain-containing protein [Novosphingobium sp. G106]|uniref:FAS1-like dehydratase domain-containing protein n=1 Tax=Novosphingobium sp. G106 TaxID=2849500 RepID=UPI002810B0A7|nr:MaoC family dehydratase N-terminal domain-containing protein [Novosphingobium sp. G106]